MTYRLCTYGSLRLTDDKGENVAMPVKGLMCLSYLHSGGYPVSRQDMAVFLWPDVPLDVAFTNLRSTLLRMQQTLKGRDRLLVVDNTALDLVEGQLTADMDCFQVAAATSGGVSDMLYMAEATAV